MGKIWTLNKIFIQILGIPLSIKAEEHAKKYI